MFWGGLFNNACITLSALDGWEGCPMQEAYQRRIKRGMKLPALEG